MIEMLTKHRHLPSQDKYPLYIMEEIYVNI